MQDLKEMSIHSLFFYNNVVFRPRLNILIYFSSDFRLEIFLYLFLNYIAYDISILECLIGVSITSVRCL